jgi:hypothetical protein
MKAACRCFVPIREQTFEVKNQLTGATEGVRHLAMVLSRMS